MSGERRQPIRIYDRAIELALAEFRRLRELSKKLEMIERQLDRADAPLKRATLGGIRGGYNELNDIERWTYRREKIRAKYAALLREYLQHSSYCEQLTEKAAPLERLALLYRYDFGLGVKDVAKRLKLSTRYVRQLTQDGLVTISASLEENLKQ